MSHGGLCDGPHSSTNQPFLLAGRGSGDCRSKSGGQDYASEKDVPLYKPCSGIMQLEGADIQEMNSRDCAALIGVVLQENPADLTDFYRGLFLIRHSAEKKT